MTTPVRDEWTTIGVELSGEKGGTRGSDAVAEGGRESAVLETFSGESEEVIAKDAEEC